MVKKAEISVKNKRIQTITGVKDGEIDPEPEQILAAIEKTLQLRPGSHIRLLSQA